MKEIRARMVAARPTQRAERSRYRYQESGKKARAKDEEKAKALYVVISYWMMKEERGRNAVGRRW